MNALLALSRLAVRLRAARAHSAAISFVAASRRWRFRARRATSARASRGGRRSPSAQAATIVSLANQRAQLTPVPLAHSPPAARRTHPRHPALPARPDRASPSGARRISRISAPLGTFVPRRRWRRPRRPCAPRATFASRDRQSAPRTHAPLDPTAPRARARPWHVPRDPPLSLARAPARSSQLPSGPRLAPWRRLTVTRVAALRALAVRASLTRAAAVPPSM
jgi:hypothetical protein